MLELNEATVKLPKKTLFENVSFTVSPGEFVSLIGPNGAGKTSVLRAILNLMPLSSGKITKAKDCRIGYMPQKLSINALMPITVDAFLDLSEGSKQKTDVIKETGIQKLLFSSLHDLSGGEYQHVILARALLNKPSLLILDEPTQGLDMDGETKFLQLLEHFHRQHNMAILMVSHDLHFVHKASQNVVCLNQHVCCSGTPNDVQANQTYQSLFTTPKTPVVATYHHDHAHSHDNLVKPTCSHDAHTVPSNTSKESH